MNSNIVVIGLGIIGQELVFNLSQKNYQVLALDSNPELVDQVSRYCQRAVCVNANDEEALEGLNIRNYDVAVCCIGSNYLKDSILVTALLNQFKIPRIIVRSSDYLHERILKKVGATEIFNPEKETGFRLANKISRPGMLELIPLAPGISLSDVIIPESFVGQNLASLDVRRKYNVNVVAIRRHRSSKDGLKEDLIINLDPMKGLSSDDILVVIGLDEDIDRLTRLG